jgi:hypothetical protein
MRPGDGDRVIRAAHAPGASRAVLTSRADFVGQMNAAWATMKVGADVLRCTPEQLAALLATTPQPRLKMWLEDLDALADYLAGRAEALRAARERLAEVPDALPEAGAAPGRRARAGMGPQMGPR